MKHSKLLFFLLLLTQYALAQHVDTVKQAKPMVPVYDSLRNKMKPSKEIGYIIINVAMDSSYQCFIIENDGKNNYRLKGIVPFAVTVLNDSLYYVLNRKYTFNEYVPDSLFYDNGKLDTIDTVLFTHKYEFPFISKNIKTITSQVTYDRNYKPKKLAEKTQNWYEQEHVWLRYFLPKFIQADYSYHGYTGGAHPNWYSYSSILRKDKFFKQPFNPDDLLTNMDSSKFNMAAFLAPEKLDSIKRVLYFKGVDGYFDDHIEAGKDLESFNVHTHDKDKLPQLDNNVDAEEGVVNYNDINYLINRGTGYFGLMTQAFAFASYVESGDGSFTASCSAGTLDKRTDPYLSNITMNDFVMIDRNIFDIYASEKYGSVVLQRLTDVTKNGKPDTDNTLRIISVSNPSAYFDLPVNGATAFMSVEWFNNTQYTNLLNQLKDCKYFEVK